MLIVRYIIHVNDIVCIIPGKLDFNNVCTVRVGLLYNEKLHLLLKSGERKTYAFESELNCSEFLNLARDCIGSMF